MQNNPAKQGDAHPSLSQSLPIIKQKTDSSLSPKKPWKLQFIGKGKVKGGRPPEDIGLLLGSNKADSSLLI